MAGHHATPTHSGAAPGKGISLAAAVSIGVGGMTGAGVFSILGVVAGDSGTALPLSFAIGDVSLYANGFAAYGLTFLPGDPSPSTPPAAGSRSSERWRSAFCSSGRTAAGPDAGSWR